MQVSTYIDSKMKFCQNLFAANEKRTPSSKRYVR